MTLARTPTGTPKELQVNDTGALVTVDASITATAGGSQVVPITAAASAASTALQATSAVVSPTVDCFMRQTDGNDATSDGSDQFLFGGLSYRVGLTAGKKLAFRAAVAGGNVYITPGA